MVLIEAMAAGLPVVASDIPGYEAVVTSGKNGVLVPPGDPGALADALVTLLTNPARRTKLSLAGQASANRYDWSRIAAALEDVYLRLTDRG
jgi:phosphatidylinositol alpha-mannosyltransferase